MKLNINGYETVLREMSKASIRAREHKNDRGDKVGSLGEAPEDFLAWMSDLGADLTLDSLRGSTIFDCRKLPKDFLLHTGAERVAELDEGATGTRLPFDVCWFEFEHCGVLLVQNTEYDDGDRDDRARHIAARVYPLPFKGVRDPLYDALQLLIIDIWAKAEWGFVYEDDPFHVIDIEDNTNGEADKQSAIEFAHSAVELCLGILVLLDEKLLTQKKEVFSISTLKANRLKKSGVSIPPREYHVLTLNVAEARRRSTNLGGTHATPMLHWRRGHWRTLHRLSEFESRTWVKRCLVGDPNKGFVSKHYNLKWEPTVH